MNKHVVANMKTIVRSCIKPKCVMDNNGLTYKKAGVNIDASKELVKRIAKLYPGIGGFAGNFQIGDDYLVSSTDGVGSKLKVAIEMGKHDTIGIDLVAMNVNDIVTSGARPLFFLDYYATGKLDVDIAEKVIKGIHHGCQEAGCLLIGGETAEMPGILREDDYDIAGFVVGMVRKDRHINGSKIKKGDVVLGIPSSGLHSNGFSLARKVLQVSEVPLTEFTPWAPYNTFGDELLRPTRIYVKDVLKLTERINVNGISHITGGGMIENIPRMFPEDKNLGVYIDTESWEVPKIFNWLQEKGDIDIHEMRRVFNMGIGMVIIVSQHDVDEAQKVIPDIRVLGEVYYKKSVAFL